MGKVGQTCRKEIEEQVAPEGRVGLGRHAVDGSHGSGRQAGCHEDTEGGGSWSRG